jgi:fucose 4-O-acetylase-like acetyltransferase
MKYNKLKNINKYDQVKKTKVKNYGISILKSVMAFLVLSHHCFNPLSTKNKIILYINKKRILHVPTFFIISFYFMCDNLLSLYIKHLLKRLIRLLIPYIGWSIIILKINNFFNKKYNTKFTDSYEELKIQIIINFGFNGI